ncbi:MAG: hypothetical protein RLW42_15510 [Gammaproteobacteria bacterium]
MWRHVLFLVVLVGGALALSWLLVPRGQELALMHYKARSYNAALAGFERAFYAPGGSTALVVPLRDLYLRQGEIDAAVAAVERALAARPTDVEVYDLALEVYRDTMHDDRYRATLERRVELAASVAQVRELAALQAFAADLAGERRALELLHAGGQATPAELMRLVRVQVADGDVAAAAATLDDWRARGLRGADRTAVAVAIDVYHGAAREDAARGLLADWLEQRFDAESLLAAVELGLEHALGRDAFRGLARALAAHAADPTLVLPAFLLAMIAEEPRLFSDYVARLDAHVGLRGVRRRGNVTAALSRRTTALLESLPGARALAGLPPESLAALARAAATAGAAQVASLLRPHLPPDLLDTDPLTAAELAILAGAPDAAQARYAAIAPGALTVPADRLRHLNLALALGHEERARAALPAMPAESVAVRVALGWIYHELDAHAAGFERLGTALEEDGTLAARQAWALLAAGAGKAAAVAAWLDAGTRAGALPPAADFLLDLALLALDGELPALLERVAAQARRTVDGSLAPDAAIAALQASGQLEAAAAVAAARLDADETARRVFLDALVRLAHQRRDVPSARRILEPGFVAVARATLAHDGVAAPLTRTLVYDLLAVGAEDVAFDVLAELVEAAPATWYDTFREAALASGERDALGTWLGARLDSVDADDPRYETWLYDLASLFGDTRALPYLDATVDNDDLATARRESAYYTLRDVALASGRRDWLVERVAAWLDTHGIADPLAPTWIYELGALGAPARALPWLEAAARAAGTPAARIEAFYAFQAAALAAGEPARVARHAAAALGAEGSDGPLGELHVETLLASPAREIARPALANLATARPARYARVYLAWLADGGDEVAAHAYAQHLATDVTLPTELRRELAERLLAAGHKQEAIAVLRDVAADADLGSDAVATLLWLWGPRPDDAALDWLAARARNATGRLRAGWSELLVERGGAARAAAVLDGDDAAAAADPVVVERRVHALLASGDKAGAAAELDALIAAEPGAALLRWAARTADEHALGKLARRGWEALVALRPRDPAALRALGLAAFDDGRRGQAERYLERYLAQVDGDVEAHFFYAELLSERGFGNRAAPHYQRVLALVADVPAPNFRLRTVQAQAHYRLGHEAAARAAFETLLAERPGAGHLRADYVTMLLEDRRLGRARELLGAREVSL